MAVTSRTELKDYCLRKLGHPVIEINVDDDQVEDRLDEALQLYQQYHSDAVVRNYVSYQVTAADITNEYITIPSGMLVVRRILPIKDSGAIDSLFSIDYQIAKNDLYSVTNQNENLVGYELMQQHLAMIDLKVSGIGEHVEFSRHQGRLTIAFRWGTDITAGQYIVIEGFSAVDPDTYTAVYDDYWLKRYATSLIKQQWGTNLSKYEGLQMPGGVTIQGRQILDDANTEIERLEEKLRLEYEDPIDFFVG